MATMTTDLAIRAPRAIVWNALADLEGVSHWNPAIDRAECISDRRTGLGARRRCCMHPSGWMVESVAEWEPLEVIAFEVENAPPLRRGYGRFVLHDHPEGTRLRGTFDYEVRFGPLGPVIDRLVVHRQLSSGWGSGMAGLRHHVEELHAGGSKPSLAYTRFDEQSTKRSELPHDQARRTLGPRRTRPAVDRGAEADREATVLR